MKWRKGLKSRTLYWIGVFLGIGFILANIHSQLITTCCTATLLCMFFGGIACACTSQQRCTATHSTAANFALCYLKLLPAAILAATLDTALALRHSSRRRTLPSAGASLPGDPTEHKGTGSAAGSGPDTGICSRGSPGNEELSSELLGAPFLPSPSSADDISINIFQLQERGGGKKTQHNAKKHSPLFLRQQRFGGRCLLWLLFKWL